jgi:Transglycosylase SLT domain
MSNETMAEKDQRDRITSTQNRSGVWIGLACLAVASAWVCFKWMQPQPAPQLEVAGVAEVIRADVLGVLQILEEELPGVDAATRLRMAQAVVEECDGSPVSPALVLALIQVESEFRPQAESERGALGLMQILPSTATDMEKREASDLKGEGLERHVRLGIRYLRRLERAFHGRMDWALMAYNVGPKRLESAIVERRVVREWRKYPRQVLRRETEFAQRLAVASQLAFVQSAPKP